MDDSDIDKLTEVAAQHVVDGLNAKLAVAAGAVAEASAGKVLADAVAEEQQMHTVPLEIAARIVYRPANFILVRELRIRNAAWQLLSALLEARRVMRLENPPSAETRAVLFQVNNAIRRAVDVELP